MDRDFTINGFTEVNWKGKEFKEWTLNCCKNWVKTMLTRRS